MVKTYGPGDKVFAKVRGYPAWPARVEGVSGDTPSKMKYHVFFYGTGDTAFCKSEELFNYIDFKEKFSKPLKKKGFNEGIAEIEADLGLTPKANLSTTLNSENDETYNSDNEDGNLVIDETPQGHGIQKKNKSVDTPTSGKHTPKTVKRKSESGKSLSSQQPVTKKASIGSSKPSNKEVTSRSGRKIKPKTFLDTSNKDNVGDNSITDAIKEEVSKATKKGLKKLNISGNNLVPSMFAVTPGGQEVKIDLTTKKSAIKTVDSKLQWQAEALKQGRDIKSKIETGELVPDAVNRDIEDKHNARQKMIEEVGNSSSEEDRETQLMYLAVETQLLNIENNIRSSLNLNVADPDLCLPLLDDFMELNVTPLMLKKHPECVETVMKIRKYIGNVKRWKLTDEEHSIFRSKAALIRAKADLIYNKFQSLFTIPKDMSFSEVFENEVIDFNQETKFMTTEEVFSLFKDPVINKQTFSTDDIDTATIE